MAPPSPSARATGRHVPAQPSPIINVGAKPRRIVRWPTPERHCPAWSPDGGLIAYAQDGVIYLARPDRSGARRLAPASRPNGRSTEETWPHTTGEIDGGAGDDWLFGSFGDDKLTLGWAGATLSTAAPETTAPRLTRASIRTKRRSVSAIARGLVSCQA